MNDFEAPAAREPTEEVLYDCALGPSATGTGARCVDLEAKAALEPWPASDALEKALELTSYDRCEDALSSARRAASSNVVTREEVPPKPAFCLPLVLELLRPSMQMPTWTLFVTLTEMILTLRLLQEGTIVPPLRRLVRVIAASAPNMTMFFLVLGPV